MESAKDFIRRADDKFARNKEKFNKTGADRYLYWFGDINRRGAYGDLKEAWTFLKQHNIGEKILVLERFRVKKINKPITHANVRVGDIEYRLGYYIVGKNGKRKNKWTWGESCPIIPKVDFIKLIKKAKKEDTIK